MIMAKYIDREALIDWLKRIPIKDLSDGLGLCRVIMEDDFQKAIKEMPKSIIADDVPMRHGRITNGGTSMKKYKLLSQALIFALIIIAAVVAVTLAAGKSAWILIIVYWVILTAKNIVDLIVFQKNK